MKTNSRYAGMLKVAIAGLICLVPSLGLAEPPVKNVPIMLKASQVLSADLLKGKNYTVKEPVKNDGLFNIYEVTTDYGPLTAQSTAVLMQRISELRALAAMDEINQSGEFGGGLVEGVKAPVRGAANLVTSPIDTTKSIFTGTGQFLSNVGRSVVSRDPHQDNVLKTALGYDASKRGYAYEFGVDPYSSYEPMTTRIGQLARASVAGGMTVSMGMSFVGSGAFGLILKYSATSDAMSQLVRDNPPGALEKINREKLEQMGVGESLIDGFLGNYTFSPQETTILVGELKSMKGVKGQDAFISLASTATDESTVLFWRRMAQMMAGYHANVTPVERIVNIGGWAFLQKGTKVVELNPMDYLFWTKDVKGITNKNKAIREKMGVTLVEYWVAGQVDPPLKAYAESEGVKVTEHANNKLIKK
ncbi:MAG: hypothetical protein QNL45_02325 [Nitrospirota bacterium]|nr:hypothetical protein [Nitrospirota bacterium]